MDYFDPFADEAAAIARLREVQHAVPRRLVRHRLALPDGALDRDRARARAAPAATVTQEEVASPWGHDSFLLEVPRYHELVAAQLRRPVQHLTCIFEVMLLYIGKC